jgi:hypothetical protein
MTSPLSIYREQVRQWIREQHHLDENEPIDQALEKKFMCQALRGVHEESSEEVIAFRALLAEFQHDVVAANLEAGAAIEDTILSECTKVDTHVQPCVCPFRWYQSRKVNESTEDPAGDELSSLSSSTAQLLPSASSTTTVPPSLESENESLF